jgi:hypothetical protein
MTRPVRPGLWALSLGVLAAVAATWMNPHRVVDLAAQVAACF